MRVYLLLRNNKQTGPYSLEELLHLGLKPDDLVWIEGKSFSWSYPSEIDALKAYVKVKEEKPPVLDKKPSTEPKVPVEKKSTDAETKKVFVSMPFHGTEKPKPVREEQPEQSLEWKAEELRKRAQQYMQQRQDPSPGSGIETKYARTLSEVEEDYTSWVYQTRSKNKKAKSRKPVVVAIAGCITLLAGYLLFHYFSSGPENTIAGNIAPLNTGAGVSQTVEIADESETTKQEQYTETTKAGDRIRTGGKEIKATDINAKTTKASHLVKSKTAATSQDAEVNNPNNEVSIQENEVAQNTENATGAKPAEEKKKKLKEKIGDFFKKLNSRNADGTSQPEGGSTAESTNSSGRQSTKREGAESAATKTDLSDYVHLSTSENGNNWMMGIKGLKLTLKNNGDEAIESASVEVRYYNEQNELLEKKVVRFSNIPPKKSQTLAAPDHRLADHTDVHLLSAYGN